MNNRVVSLERLDFAATHAIPQVLLDHTSIERVEDLVTQRLVFMLRTKVYAQRLDEQVVRHPADWWEAVKQRWFPQWLVRRWPVRETIHTMRLYAWYPDKLIPRERSQFLVQIGSEDQ